MSLYKLAHVKTALLLLIALAGFSACTAARQVAGPSPAQAAQAVNPNPVDAEYVRKRVIAWYPIGHSSRDTSVRMVGRNLKKTGWDGFVKQSVLPVLKRYGFKRVMIHNPFGTLPGEAMQFDQYLTAKKAGLNWLTDGFVAAWKPVTASGVEVIGYLGNPHLDPESQKLLKSKGEKAVFERGWKAIDPLVQSGMSIGYDAAVITGKNSATYHFAQMMRARGLKVYVEARPRIDKPWWFDYPVVAREDTWQKTMPTSPQAPNRKFASRADLKSDIVRIARVPARWKREHKTSEWPQIACRIIAEGDSAVIEDFILKQPGRKLSDLVNCVNQYKARFK